MTTTKERVIKYIFSNIVLDKYKYNLIRNDLDLDFICVNNPYFGFNYYGYNNLLVFTKFNDSYYSFFIDRKTLSYNMHKVDPSKVHISQVNLEIQDELYNGTIFDGILNDNNGKMTYIITDAYYIAGQSFEEMNYKDKMKYIKENIPPKIKINKNTDNITILVEDVHVYSDLQAITNIVENTVRTDNKISARGLIFYPEKSGIKYILTLKMNKQHKSIDEKKYSSRENQPEVVPRNSMKDSKILEPTAKTAIMLLKKTDMPDVYNVALRKTKKKMENIGIACIPTFKISKLCKTFFEKSSRKSESEESESEESESDKSESDESDESDDEITEVVVLCTWIPKFKKWQPVELSKGEVDFVDDIYE